MQFKMDYGEAKKLYDHYITGNVPGAKPFWKMMDKSRMKFLLAKMYRSINNRQRRAEIEKVMIELQDRN